MRVIFHPLALVVLIASLLVAVVVDQRAPWSGRAPWIAAWGTTAYIAVVAVTAIRRVHMPSTPVDDRFERAGEAAADQTPNPGEVTVRPGGGEDEMAGFVHDALRQLNSPALGECALAARLPCTVASYSAAASGASDVGPVFRTRALRAALAEAIERLSAGGPNTPSGDALRFVILQEEYILGRPNSAIMVRHSISESTFHRYRRQAVRVLAAELARQEERLAAEARPESPSP